MILSILIAVAGLGILFVLGDQLGKRLPSWIGHPKETPPSDPPKPLSGEDLIRDPGLFAHWICEYVIDATPWTDEISPSDENCQRLGLSEAERVSCANENILIRAVSVIRYLEICGSREDYLDKFKRVIFERVSRRMRERSHPNINPDPETGMTMYLLDLRQENAASAFCSTYILRVYPEHFDIFLSAKNIGIPLLVFESVSGTMNLVRNAVEKLAKK